MRGSAGDIRAYLSAITLLLERAGVALPPDAAGERTDLLVDATAGDLSFSLAGDLPGDERRRGASVIVREGFRRGGRDLYVRNRYVYEVLDHERDYRRAFHLHSPEWFAREHLVLVHEHCERPIGHVACRHYESTPIRDGFAGVMALMEIWTGPAPDCADLRCLE